MSQQDVHAFLKDNPDKWFTSKEISDMLGVSLGSTTISLKRLRETGEVEYWRFRELSGGPYQYRFKD